MSDHLERLMELERKVAELEAQNLMAKLELQREQASAGARISMLEAQLESERNIRETTEQAQTDYQQALEGAYKAELEQLRAEVQLWRRDDRPGLLRHLAARREAIERSIAAMSSDESSDFIERMRAQRAELADLEARLS